MKKKTYRRPELKTRKVELGVFGSYADNVGETTPMMPVPVEVIDKLNLKME